MQSSQYECLTSISYKKIQMNIFFAASPAKLATLESLQFDLRSNHNSEEQLNLRSEPITVSSLILSISILSFGSLHGVITSTCFIPHHEVNYVESSV